MHYFPRTSEILLYSSHWRIDGIGFLPLLESFLNILAHPQAVEIGNEGVDEAASFVSKATPRMGQAATDLVMQHVNNLP